MASRAELKRSLSLKGGFARTGISHESRGSPSPLPGSGGGSPQSNSGRSSPRQRIRERSSSIKNLFARIVFGNDADASDDSGSDYSPQLGQRIDRRESEPALSPRLPEPAGSPAKPSRKSTQQARRRRNTITIHVPTPEQEEIDAVNPMSPRQMTRTRYRCAVCAVETAASETWADPMFQCEGCQRPCHKRCVRAGRFCVECVKGGGSGGSRPSH